MAATYVDGSPVGSSGRQWRCRLGYEVTSDTATQYTIDVGGNTIAVGANDGVQRSRAAYSTDGVYAYGSSSVSQVFSCTIAIDGVTVYSDNSPYGPGVWRYYGTIDKTHSARSVTISMSSSSTNQMAWVESASPYTVHHVNGTSTASATVTVPPLASYVVAFNANGGMNAPSSQTKWYGETLTLSTTQPTRSGHKFVGWATSPSATTASYQPGASYKSNAALALYAVWQKMPVISNVTLSRVNSNGNADEAGGYVKVTASYQSDYAVTASSIAVGSLSASTGAKPAGTGTVTATLGDGSNILPLTAYTATVSMTSKAGTSTGTGSLAASSTYARPTVAVTSLKRVASASSTVEDDLGRYLMAEVSYSVAETASQAGPSGVRRRFADLDASDVAVAASSASGALRVYSPRFDYQVIAPGSAKQDALTVTVSDRFYSASATAALGPGGYFQPRVSNVNAARSDADGNLDDEGKTARILVDWSVTPSKTQTAPQSLVVSAYDMSGALIASKALKPSGTSASTAVTFTSADRAQGAPVVGANPDDLFDTEQKYRVAATLADLYTSTSRGDVLSAAYFTLDVLAGGHGIAMGKPASTAELLDVGYEVHSDTEVSATDTSGARHELTKKADKSDVDALVTGVSGVKGNAESSYRTGDVNLTYPKIGTCPVANGGTGATTAANARTNLGITPANIGAVSKAGDTMSGGLDIGGNAAVHGDLEVRDLVDFHGANNWTDDYTARIYAPRNDGELWVLATNGRPMFTCYRGGSPEQIAKMYIDQEGGNFGWTSPDGHYHELDSYDNVHTRIYTWLGSNLHSLTWRDDTDYDLDQFRRNASVLYNNASGTNGTVALSASAASYNHMRIFFRGNDSQYDSADVFSPNGKVAALVVHEGTGNASLNEKRKAVTISGTSITVKNYSEIDNSGSPGAANNVYITRVEAWNE